MAQEDSSNSLTTLIPNAWGRHREHQTHRDKTVEALALRLAARQHPEVVDDDPADQRKLTRYFRGPAEKITDHREAKGEVARGELGRFDELWDVVSDVICGWTDLTPDELEEFATGNNERARQQIVQAEREGCLGELNRELTRRCRPSELAPLGLSAAVESGQNGSASDPPAESPEPGANEIWSPMLRLKTIAGILECQPKTRSVQPKLAAINSELKVLRRGDYQVRLDTMAPVYRQRFLDAGEK